jgi:hypothetical protein
MRSLRRSTCCCRACAQRERNGVDDGTRTHDSRDHNPGLYQLSYVHRRHTRRSPPSLRGAMRRAQSAATGAPGRTRTCDPRLRRPMLYPAELRAHPERPWSLAARDGRGREIRTPDPLLPKQMRYQTAPCPALKHTLHLKAGPRPTGPGMIRNPPDERQFTGTATRDPPIGRAAVREPAWEAPTAPLRAARRSTALPRSRRGRARG